LRARGGETPDVERNHAEQRDTEQRDTEHGDQAGSMSDRS
jgi:hypothetical protein